MNRRHSLILLAALALGAVAASGPGPTLRWVCDASGRPTAVEAVGLTPGGLDLTQAPNIFTIRVDASGKNSSAMLGTYRMVGEVLRFEPRFPLDRGRRYRATFQQDGLTVQSTFEVPRLDHPKTVVTRVDPASATVPENLLKYYVHFSAPMSRGEAYTRVRVLDADGRPLELPFLELGEELWDSTATRLTLLLDPGRIKRGLKPREELGPILEEGRSYTLEVASGWRDAEGQTLGEPFRKSFRVGPADLRQPDPKTWTITPPASGTRDPITIRSPEPLDRAMLESCLTLVDTQGQAVAGRTTVEADGALWKFTPETPWVTGEYLLMVEDDLEDLAGNSIRRPFEIDATGPVTSRRPSGHVRLPIPIP